MVFETGNDMKRWRLEHNMTQKYLANRIGYTKDRIAHLETDNGGKNRLSKRMQRVLTTLDNSISDELIHVWRRRITDTTFMSYFAKEFSSLGKALSVAINKTPKEFYGTLAYIELLELYIRTFLKTTQTPEDIKSVIQPLISKSTDYRKNYLPKK